MKYKSRIILFLIGLFSAQIVIGQKPAVGQFIEWEATTYSYTSSNKLVQVDTTNKNPINGWTRFINEDRAFFRHYTDGVLNGYSVFYVKKKDKLRLQEISRYEKGEIRTKAYFSPRNQSYDSASYSNGLKSYSIWFPDSTKKELIYLERKNLQKKKIIGHYYYPEGNFKLKIKFAQGYYCDLMHRKSFELGQKYFPFELNDNNDPFSFIRYDGYYYFNECFDATCKKGRTLFIKFYPNKTAVIVERSVLTARNDSWNDTLSKVNKIDYLNSKNITSNSFEIKDSSLTIVAKGKIIEQGMLLESRAYEKGPFLRHYLNFVKE